MSNLKDFNWNGFWKDTDYAFESYIGRDVTDEDINSSWHSIFFAFWGYLCLAGRNK